MEIHKEKSCRLADFLNFTANRKHNKEEAMKKSIRAALVAAAFCMTGAAFAGTTTYEEGYTTGFEGSRASRGGPPPSDEFKAGREAGRADKADGSAPAFSVNKKFIRNSAMALVQGGSIKGKGAEYGEMGLIDEGAKLDPYYIGKYEVTQEFYEAVIGSQKGAFDKAPSSNLKDTLVKGEAQERRPVESVTWYDAISFCNALSKIQGLQEAYTIKVKAAEGGHITDADVSWNKKANGYRLPSEEEWELACRGGDPAKKDFAYSFSGASSPSYDGKAATSADLDKVGWYLYNPGGKTSSTKGSKGTPGYCSHEVGKKGGNALGIFDMSGNVYEWVFDVGDDGERIVRGGAFTTSAAACKITAYNDEKPSKRLTALGFRIARNAK